MESYINNTKQWLEQVVIRHNFCPFAKKEWLNHRIRYQTCPTEKTEAALEALAKEWHYLDTHPEMTTTLLIFTQGFHCFDDYLNLVDIANALLEAQDYEGVYQLASFHPDYCFAETDPNDPANYTNRSPYPILHLLREKDLEKAIAMHPNSEGIPDRNIAYAQKIGLKTWQATLKSLQ
ncbi:MAG: DUF1415 domain-containing protein [Cocleimonas sp.]|nr:DUF1415 domain-containing protein [Cocleimonas sp.]